MSLNELLQKAITLFPHKDGIVCGDNRFTYMEFAQRVFKLGHAFIDLGLEKGDRVAIIHENCHRFLEAYFGAAQLGLILVPVNIRLSAREINQILLDCSPRILISQPIFFEKVMDSLKDVQGLNRVIWTGPLTDRGDYDTLSDLMYEDILSSMPGESPPHVRVEDSDLAQIYYTSGTTGRPKGVMLTHKNVKTHALGAMAELKITDRDVWIHAAPMFHLADAWASFSVTWAGGRHLFIPTFDPVRVFDMIEREGVTITNLIPTMLNMMVNHPDVSGYDYSSLRVLLSGGAPIAPELVRKIMDTFGCDYIQTYGMTETSPYLTMSILKEHLEDLPWEEKLRYKSSTGREFVTVNLRVVDDMGKDVPKDGKSVGEIIVKGDTVTPGYWNLPEETEAAFHDGWLKTGDMAVMDHEGYVNIVDRKKDMILSGGENVYSVEVENVLYMNDAILEAAVIGVPDSYWGEVVKAFVVLKPGRNLTEEDVIRFCKEHLAHFKAPKIVSFVESLPKTGSGKIYKEGLRNMDENRHL